MTLETDLDERNARFWDMLCGWSMAQAIGVTGDEREDLMRFDRAYLSYYPYLARYVDDDLTDRRVLEVGLGFGTLGQIIVERGAEYHGVDIAAEPVSLMKRRFDSQASEIQTVSSMHLHWLYRTTTATSIR